MKFPSEDSSSIITVRADVKEARNYYASSLKMSPYSPPTGSDDPVQPQETGAHHTDHQLQLINQICQEKSSNEPYNIELDPRADLPMIVDHQSTNKPPRFN